MSGPQLQNIFDTVRIPIYQPATFNAGKFRAGSNDVNRQYWNCFPVGSGQEVWIEKRQTISNNSLTLTTPLASTTTSNCYYNMVMTQLNDVFVCAIYDSTNTKFVIIQYRPTTGTTTKIGEIASVSSTDEVFLSELVIGGVPYLGVVYHNNTSTASKAYYAASSGGVFGAASLTQIVDVDFPDQLGTPDYLTGPMVQLNRITYVMGKSGKIYNSDYNSITSWNGAGVADAAMYPDQGIGLCRYKHHIVAFKENSIEFWNDVGNAAPATPLSRTDQAFIKFGCISPRAFINIDDTLYWVARSSSGVSGIYNLQGYTPQKITTQDGDAIIARSAENFTQGPHILRLWPITFNAKKHLMVGSLISGAGLGIVTGMTFSGDVNSLAATECNTGQFMICLDNQESWFFQAAFSGLVSKFFPLAISNYQSTNISANTQYFPGSYVSTNSTTIGQNIFSIAGDITNSSMSGWDFSSATDVTGSVPVVGFQLNNIDFNNNKRKRVHKLTLIQRGLSSNSSAANVWFCWDKQQNVGTNVNDYLQAPTQRSITLPNLGYRWYITNLGQGRDWTFGVVIKTIDPIAFKELEVDVSQGEH
jgi:hypothetical protein